MKLFNTLIVIALILSIMCACENGHERSIEDGSQYYEYGNDGNYIIICSLQMNTVVEIVNTRIEDGFLPLGSPTNCSVNEFSSFCCQAMTKTKDVK